MGKELEILDQEPPPGVVAWPSTPECMLQLKARIMGPPDTPFEDGEFEVDIEIPERYPFEPPKMKFVTPIYHPNIDSGGRICLSTLVMGPKGSWTPALNISTVLTSLRSLIAEPNVEDPLVVEICDVYKNSPQLYEKTAREWCKRYAAPKDSLQATSGDAPDAAAEEQEQAGAADADAEEDQQDSDEQSERPRKRTRRT